LRNMKTKLFVIIALQTFSKKHLNHKLTRKIG
jgi:hypothetical protein